MKSILTILILVNYLFTYAQKSPNNKGYFGTRFYSSLESTVNSPLLYNLSSFNGELKVKYFDKINLGFRLSGGFIFSKKAAFVLEFGRDYGSILNVKEGQYSNYYNSSSNGYSFFQDIKVVSTSIIPKFEFRSKNGILPIGITHTLGFGITNVKINTNRMNDYVYVSNDNSYYYNDFELFEKTINKSKFSFVDDHKLKMLTLLYSLNLKSSITKRIFINYGFRYTINIAPSFFEFPDFGNNYGRIDENLKIFKNTNLLSFSLGFTYLFSR